MDDGRVPDGTGLSQQVAEPASRLGPSGFDPAREAALMTSQERRYLMATPLQIHASAGWIALSAGHCGGGRTFAGFARTNGWLFRYATDSRGRLEYRLSADGYWVREAAIAMEARRGETTGSTAEGGDSAGPKDIAQ